MHTLIVTVGTSIIEKTWKQRDRNKYEQLVGDGTASSKPLLYDKDKEAIERGIGWNKINESLLSQRKLEEECLHYLKPIIVKDEVKKGRNNRLSAEISSLSKLFDSYLIAPSECRILLLATDSQDGIWAARLNKLAIACKFYNTDQDTVLQQNGCEQLQIQRINDLQVFDRDTFLEGSSNLQKHMHSIQIAYGPNQDSHRMIVNLTGGFKAVLPILTGSAWRLGWDLCYLFEESNELIWIDKPSWVAPLSQNDSNQNDEIPCYSKRPSI